MTTPANPDAGVRGQGPPPGNIRAAGANIDVMRGRRPLAGVGVAEQPLPARPVPHTDRPALVDITTAPNPTWGIETGMSERLGGQHGLIVRPVVGMSAGPGGMEPWRVDRRILRNSPTDTWDAGTAALERD